VHSSGAEPKRRQTGACSDRRSPGSSEPVGIPIPLPHLVVLEFARGLGADACPIANIGAQMTRALAGQILVQLEKEEHVAVHTAPLHGASESL
jgi:hypothetical protein